jgi:two-component system sensor histidine kinase YesM
MKLTRTHDSLSRKFLVLSISIILFPMVTLGILTYKGFSTAIDRKIIELSDTLLELANTNIDYIIGDVRDTANLVLTSRSVQTVLRTAADQMEAKAFQSAQVDMHDLLMNMINNKTYIASLYVGNDRYHVMKQKGKLFGMQMAPFSYQDPPQWLLSTWAHKGQGTFHRGDRIEGFSENVLVYTKEIRNLNTLERIGILVIGVDTASLDVMFSGLSRMQNIHLYISSGEEIIYEYGTNQSGLLSSLEDEQKRYLISQAEAQPEGAIEIDGDLYHVRALTDNPFDWTITAVLSSTDFTAEKERMVVGIVVIGLLAFAIALVGSFYFTKHSIVGTLNRLRVYVDSLRQGQPGAGIEFDTSDEVGMIGSEFMRVVSENERLSVNLYKSLYREKEAELMALQAQINPHFLYNVLDSLFWVAQTHDEPQIADLVLSFSRFFRLSLNQGHKYTTLGKELELVRNYLVLQNFRHGDKFSVVYSVDEGLLDQTIIAFVIQPLVENSILHGLEGKPGGGRIEVGAWIEGQDLVLSVVDDGIGFDCLPKDAMDRGYALRNIDERIKLMCGEGYGMSIETCDGEGTRVLLRLRRSLPVGEVPTAVQE